MSSAISSSKTSRQPKFQPGTIDVTTRPFPLGRAHQSRPFIIKSACPLSSSKVERHSYQCDRSAIVSKKRSMSAATPARSGRGSLPLSNQANIIDLARARAIFIRNPNGCGHLHWLPCRASLQKSSATRGVHKRCFKRQRVRPLWSIGVMTGMSGMVKDFGCRPARGHSRARGRRPKSAQGRTRGPRATLWGFIDSGAATAVGCEFFCRTEGLS